MRFGLAQLSRRLVGLRLLLVAGFWLLGLGRRNLSPLVGGLIDRVGGKSAPGLLMPPL